MRSLILLLVLLTGCVPEEPRDSQQAASSPSESPRKIHLRSTFSLRGVGSAAYLPDGRLIAACSDGSLRLWDGASGRSLRVLSNNGARTERVISGPGEGRFVTIGEGSRVTLWDLASGRPLHNFEGLEPQRHGYGAAVSRDGKMLATGDYDDSKGFCIRLWNLDTYKEERRLFYREIVELEVLEFSDDGKQLLTMLPYHVDLSPGRWAAWDLREGKVIQTYSVGQTNPGNACFVGGDSVIGSAQNGIYLFDRRTGARRAYRQVTGGPLAISTNGLLATGGWRNVTTLWDASKLTKLAKAGGDLNLVPGAWVQDLSFSPDGKCLVVTGYDDVARGWVIEEP